MELVSIIIPAYNQGNYLSEAIESALEQSYPNIEIIIVDDGSTDVTSDVSHRYIDHVRYVYQDNQGLSAARNTGIRNARGTYLSFLDSDDMFLPDKINDLIAAINEDPQMGLAAGQAIPIDEQGERVGTIFDTPLPHDPEYLLLGNPLHVGSVLLRANWVENVGFFDENLRSYEDWDMWLRLLLAGCKTAWVPKPVSLYRFHGRQMTRDGSQMTNATFDVLDKVYGEKTLPKSWNMIHDKAYSRANLRAAAQAYYTNNTSRGKHYLEEAIQLDPTLLSNDGAGLAEQFAAWINLPKSNDPLGYLETIYNNLPSDLEKLSTNQKEYLGEAAIQMAFVNFQENQYQDARYAVLRAVRYQPNYLLNRGTWKILVTTISARY